VDEIDLKVVRYLMAQGRITWSELAGILKLSAPATAERVRRLEERGVITGYTALINPEAIDYSLTAFIAVTLEQPEHLAIFLQRVGEMQEVQECHHIAGDYDYLLKVRCRNTKDLERVISANLKQLPGTVRTRTTVVLSTFKESTAFPLPSSDNPVTNSELDKKT
jgi:Lrp/AsnC family leucine-responsive transcriptional regulator